MLTIKNFTAKIAVFAPLTLAILLAGCMPKGPRALLDGKEFIDRGRYADAVEKLQTATSLMSTNAVAWNYLGLAYHQTGAATNAEQAYLRAISLDRNLVEAHYNLGCLRLGENRLEPAKSEFITYTSLRGNNPDGWLKLATTQLRLRELTAAEKSFGEALRLNRENPEALNGLGMVQLQRRNFREAVNSFNSALKVQPEYAPALLNLAVVNQDYLNNRPAALQKYREYLALPNHPPNWAAVNETAQALERELTPPPKVVVANAALPTPAPVVSQSKAQTAPPPIVIKAQTNAPSHVAVSNKPEPAINVAKPVPAPEPSAPIDFVKLPPEPLIKSAQDMGAGSKMTTNTRVELQSVASAPAKPDAAKPEKRSFLKTINPMNLFRRSTNTESASSTPANGGKSGSAPDFNADALVISSARYKYKNPAKPAVGDRSAAELEFNKGFQAHRSDRLPQAVLNYQQAIRLDPSYFEAYYNLGVASTAVGNLSQALTAYETALVLRPESLDARYNFAFVLKQANFIADAVNQFEELLTRYPKEARAHVILGNIYSQQLKLPARAREHYQAVLDIDPGNSQAPAIRYWLTTH